MMNLRYLMVSFELLFQIFQMKNMFRTKWFGLKVGRIWSFIK